MPSAVTATELTPLCDVSELAAGRKVVRAGAKQIAVFRVEDRFYAIDNRCPHMGYPLSMGTLKGEALTCDWHNWKFDLADGRCVLRGSEDVRSYPVTVSGGRVLADLHDLPIEEQMANGLENLRRGLKRFDQGGIARDAVRLLTLGMAPAELMRLGAVHNAEREEFGWGHALAVIADCASLTEFYTGDEAALPVVQALWAAAEPVRHYRLRPHADATHADREGESEFRRRIEDEDVDGAEAWLRGAIDGGLPAAELSRWLVNAASDHFLGFGHQAIYVFKAHQFARRVGWEGMAEVIPSIVPSIAWATRYDRLPEMRKYIARLRAIEETLPAIAVRQRRPSGATFNAERFRGEVLHGKGDAAFEAVHGALAGGVAAGHVAQELALAASERLLRMDLDWETSHDERVWDEGGWLEVTHLLTHANASRQLLSEGVTAEALRNLYHNAWFINYQKRFDHTDGSRVDRGALPEPRGGTPDELAFEYRAAVQGKRYEEAMGIVRAWGTRGLPKTALLSAMAHEAMEANDGDFISMAHVLKTTHAAIEEHRNLGNGAESDLPLMAATRYIASPRKERAVYDAALNSVKFVRSGAARAV